MIYNLWDTDTNGYFGQYTDEGEALALVRTLVDRYGAEYAENLSLGRVNDDGSIAEPLEGAALVARAEEKPARGEAVVAESGRAKTLNARRAATRPLPTVANGRAGSGTGAPPTPRKAARSPEGARRVRSLPDG